MTINKKHLKFHLRRYASKQKQKLIHRVVNPARFIADLTRVRVQAQTKNTGSTRIALITDRDAYTSDQQFHPFSEFRSELREKLGLISIRLLLSDVLAAPKLILSSFDVIGLKMSYRTTSAEALKVVRKIRNSTGGKCVIYFDGDDDLCVQWPEILPYVDLYVKKHVFRDRGNYLKQYVGKSNLHDYVHRKYGHAFSTRDYGGPNDRPTIISNSGPVASDQLSKIKLGFNIALDRHLLDLYKKLHHLPPQNAKEYDVAFRGTISSEYWSYYLRKDIAPILTRLRSDYRLNISSARVSQEEYYREMISSRICVSPFGYGEICWRDFEAILCGCLLIKPDMSHVETNPDVFRPYETYVPVKWDFSDLEEKCKNLLEDEGGRQRIVAQAFNVLTSFYEKEGFLESTKALLSACPRDARGHIASLADGQIVDSV